MAIIPNTYLNAVVSIGRRKSDDKIAWFGTGFFVHRKKDDTHGFPFLVTNKHVLKSVDTIVIRMKENGTENLKEWDMKILDNGTPLYSVHPEADIAVMPLNARIIESNNLQFDSFDIDNNALTSTELRETGCNEGTFVYMLGFPLGIVNEESGLPICRLGCIARISKAQIKEKQNILVDIQNFPGNSGSPIINRPDIIAIKGQEKLDRSVLIGIVHSYIPYEESLVNLQTGRTVEIRSENSGLANVHPVEYIREVIETIEPLQKK